MPLPGLLQKYQIVLIPIIIVIIIALPLRKTERLRLRAGLRAGFETFAAASNRGVLRSAIPGRAERPKRGKTETGSCNARIGSPGGAVLSTSDKASRCHSAASRRARRASCRRLRRRQSPPPARYPGQCGPCDYGSKFAVWASQARPR